MNPTDEVTHQVLEKMAEIDGDIMNSTLHIENYINRELGYTDFRLPDKIIDQLEQEALIRSSPEGYGHYSLTNKGREITEEGGWPSYREQMNIIQRKAARAAEWAEMKARGEGLYFKYWWLPIFFGVVGATGTVYQLFNDNSSSDVPTRAEFDKIVREIDSLKKNRPIPIPALRSKAANQAGHPLRKQ